LLKGARLELPRRLEQELAAFGQKIKQTHRPTGLNVKRAATDHSHPRIFAGLPLIRTCDAVNATDAVSATVSHAIVASPVQSGFTPARRSRPAATAASMSPRII
jgi:hypothetical protein